MSQQHSVVPAAPITSEFTTSLQASVPVLLDTTITRSTHLAFFALMIASLAPAPLSASPATPTGISMPTIAAHASPATLPMGLTANLARFSVLLAPVPQTARPATAIELLSTSPVSAQLPSTQWLGRLAAMLARSVAQLA